MNEKAIILTNQIRKDMAALAVIFTALEQTPLPKLPLTPAKEEKLIVIAYRLHHLYTGFENIFQNISTLFENSVDDVGRWHAQLLERMQLNALPLRPQVIDQAAYVALDELRRFRHMFRHAYSVQLDPDRLQLVYRKAMALKSLYTGQLENFITFLQTLE